MNYSQCASSSLKISGLIAAFALGFTLLMTGCSGSDPSIIIEAPTVEAAPVGEQPLQ